MRSPRLFRRRLTPLLTLLGLHGRGSIAQRTCYLPHALPCRPSTCSIVTAAILLCSEPSRRFPPLAKRP